MNRLLTALATTLLLVPTLARADEISSDEDVCRRRELGDACSFDGVDGHCRAATCSGIDYSGGKPKGIERSCRRCLAEPAATAEPTKAEPATVPAKTSGAAASSPDSSGCAVDRSAGSLVSISIGAVAVLLARRRSF